MGVTRRCYHHTTQLDEDVCFTSRMSDDHCTKFSSHTDTEAKILEISSVNRAASDMATIDDVHTNLYKCSTTLAIDGEVTRRCYHHTTQLDEDVCFTSRTSDSAQ